MDERAKGYTLTLTGGLLLTIDVPLLKLSGAEGSTLIFVRGLLVFVGMHLFWVLFRRGKSPYINGYTTVFIAGLMGFASIFFIAAIELTSVANVVFILAFNPMFAAILSRVFLGERIDLAMILAILCALVGIGVIVGGSISKGAYLGDLCALAATFLLAACLTLVRRKRSDQMMAPAWAALVSSAAVMFFATPSEVTLSGWGWLALNGLVILPLIHACLMSGPRYIPAPAVAMFYLLEAVITPIWIWLLFAEVPPDTTFIGGAIVLAALAVHSIWSLSARRPGLKSARSLN